MTISHSTLQKFTKILLKKRDETDIDFAAMGPADYRKAITYYFQLTGVSLIKDGEDRWVSFFGEGSWLTVANELNAEAANLIEAVVENNGAEIKNIKHSIFNL